MMRADAILAGLVATDGPVGRPLAAAQVQYKEKVFFYPQTNLCFYLQCCCVGGDGFEPPTPAL